MLNYEEFKEEVKKCLPKYIPEEMELSSEIKPYHKVNRTMDGMSVSDKNSDGTVISVIYIDEMYSDYLHSGFEETLLHAVDQMKAALEHSEDLANAVEEWNTNIKENIVFQLINTEQNAELLRTVPHRPFHDLSVIYRWDLSEKIGGFAWSLITNKQAEALGLSEETLYQLARENTRRLYKPEILSMREIFNNILEKAGVSADEVQDIANMQELDMWIATNNRKMEGACTLLYEELFYELSGKEKTDFYILPSSIHEVLLVPKEKVAGTSSEEFAEFVMHVNETQVSLADRLSNQVYFYDREAREITQITHTENKQLAAHTSEVQEMKMPYRSFRGTSR